MAKKRKLKKIAVTGSKTATPPPLEPQFERAKKIPRVVPPDENPETPAEVKTVPVAPPPKQLKWRIESMEDFSQLPNHQIDKATYYIRHELRKANMTGKTVKGFIWHEGGKLETELVDGDPLA